MSRFRSTVPLRLAKNTKSNLIKVITFLVLLVFATSLLFAQHNVFSAGSAQTLTITNGTIFSADSLVFLPSSDITIASNALRETPVAVAGTPNNSIARVYYLNNPITFTGSVLIYYQLSELNGNTESALKFSDSTIGSYFWMISASSSVNTATHSVLLTASNKILVAATAAQVGTLLLLKLLSFGGEINGNNVTLTWTVDQNEESKNFILQSSAEGLNWQEVATVEGSQVKGIYKYYYNDENTSWTTKFYRIILTALSGQIIYSPIIKLSNGNNLNDFFVTGNNNSAIVHFIGMQPKNIRVINSAGQIIYTNNISRYQYEINNLLPGYILSNMN